MKHSVTVTQAVHRLSDYLNRVAYRGERFVLIRGKKPVAELRPLPRGRTLRELPDVLASLPRLGPAEAAAFDRDLRRARSRARRRPTCDGFVDSLTEKRTVVE